MSETIKLLGTVDGEPVELEISREQAEALGLTVENMGPFSIDPKGGLDV